MRKSYGWSARLAARVRCNDPTCMCAHDPQRRTMLRERSAYWCTKLTLFPTDGSYSDNEAVADEDSEAERRKERKEREKEKAEERRKAKASEREKEATLEIEDGASGAKRRVISDEEAPARDETSKANAGEEAAKEKTKKSPKKSKSKGSDEEGARERRQSTDGKEAAAAKSTTPDWLAADAPSKQK